MTTSPKKRLFSNLMQFLVYPFVLTYCIMFGKIVEPYTIEVTKMCTTALRQGGVVSIQISLLFHGIDTITV